MANVVPDECVQIFNLFKEKKFDEAVELQYRLTPLAKEVTTKYGIGGLKIAMDVAGYFGGDPRAPLKKPGLEVREELSCQLNRLKGIEG